MKYNPTPITIVSAIRLMRAAMLTFIGCVSLVSSSHAIVMNFDPPYWTGNLISQGGTTKWTGGYGGDLRVVANTIDGTGQMLAVVTQGYTNAYFNASTADLGNPFINTSSEVLLSLKYAKTTSNASMTGNEISRFWLGNGGNAPFMLEFEDNGAIGYKSGNIQYYITTDGSLSTSKTAAFNLFAVGAWNDISADLNYATNTYTLSVNGVAQFGGSAISFINTTSANLTPNIFWTVDNNANTGLAFDNLSLSVVPEPSTISILSLFAPMIVCVGVMRARLHKQLQ